VGFGFVKFWHNQPRDVCLSEQMVSHDGPSGSYRITSEVTELPPVADDAPETPAQDDHRRVTRPWHRNELHGAGLRVLDTERSTRIGVILCGQSSKSMTER